MGPTVQTRGRRSWEKHRSSGRFQSCTETKLKFSFIYIFRDPLITKPVSTNQTFSSAKVRRCQTAEAEHKVRKRACTLSTFERKLQSISALNYFIDKGEAEIFRKDRQTSGWFKRRACVFSKEVKKL